MKERDLEIAPDEQAAQWFARVRSGSMSDAEALELEQWLQADAGHRAAFERYRSLWAALTQVRDEPRILRLREDARAPRPGVRRIAAVGGVAAILTAICVVYAYAVRHGAVPEVPFVQAATSTTHFETGVGQISHLVLADGSAVTLDTDAALAVGFSLTQRSIHLTRGRAYFRVAHEQRPFVVNGPNLSVTATGTEFILDVSDGSNKVSMLQGSVIAEPAAGRPARERIALGAGKSLSADATGHWQMGVVDIERERSWLRGELTFREQTLDEIARELNRYSERKIVFGDDAVRQRRLSAILRAGDLETFVSAVEELRLARVQTRDTQSIVLTTP